jgi:hypothetical protein
MDRPGKLRLDLFDGNGAPLNERIDIFLSNQSLTDPVAIRGIVASKPIVIKNLLAAPNGLYRLFIDPPSYMPVSVFVNISGSKVTERAIPFAIDPGKVVRVQFPDYSAIDYAHALFSASRSVLGLKDLSGEMLYSGMDDISRAGTLNILSKSRRTPLTGGGVVLDHVREIQEVRGDRCFARVAPELGDSIRNSMLEGLFHEVSGALHKRPGFEPAGSFKTADRYGNLQVTLFTKGNETVADIDIDDAAGLEHVFQVARNAITGGPTHPYNIRDILLRYQEIDPGYRFVLNEERLRTKASGQKA